MLTEADTDFRLRHAIDKLEIQELLSRYCRAVDRLDFEILREIFDEAATVELGKFHKGDVEGFIGVAKTFMGSMERTSHALANCIIEIDGDEAGSETYVSAHHVLDEEGSLFELIVGARYLNRFVRRSDGWRISHHTEVMDWGVHRPFGSWFADSDDMPKGNRNRADPSYKFI
ncbi:MAG: nuclear transport factor 2 family protein [Pseudomonadota bacterium]